MIRLIVIGGILLFKIGGLDRVLVKSKKIGYKRAQNNRIIKLEILGKTNEDRTTIVDKYRAEMRTSQAKVLDIYDADGWLKQRYASAHSLNDPKFIYEIGKIVIPKNGYNNDINMICDRGIHYFLTEEAAYNYNSNSFSMWGKNGEIVDFDKKREYDIVNVIQWIIYFILCLIIIMI